jgi:apolipoprotein N-acyltransferase
MQFTIRKFPVRLLLAAFSGVLLSLAWLGFPGWSLFVAFLPLLLLDDFFVRNQRQYKSVSFFGWAFLSFLIWNGLTTWWILHATPAGALFAVLVNSLLMSLVFWTAHWVRRKSLKNTGYLAYIAFWISFEFLHFHWDIEWPWLTLGNGFANDVKLVQWYEITGTTGGSLWVWLINLFIYHVLKQVAESKLRRKLIPCTLMAAGLILLPVAWSLFRYHTWNETGSKRKVLIVQPNIDPYTESHEEGAVNDKLLKFIHVAEKNLTADVDYITGPETVFEENWNEARLYDYPAFRQLQLLTGREGNPCLIIGASTYRIYDEPGDASSTARHSRDGTLYDVYNSALFLDPSQGYQVYHKSILVPGVEKMPYRKYLRFLDRLMINLGGTSGSLGVQKEPANFVAPRGDLIAPAICYESVFGEYIAAFIRKGAGLIFIITNDGWWKNTPGYRQHFSFSRLRAIETRRWVVRCANTGISGFINPRGDVVQKSKWWEESALTGEVYLSLELSGYVRFGDFLARTAIFASVLLLLNAAVLSFIRRRA